MQLKLTFYLLKIYLQVITVALTANEKLHSKHSHACTNKIVNIG